MRRGRHGIATRESADDRATTTRRASTRSGDGRSDKVAQSWRGVRCGRQRQRTRCRQLRQAQGCEPGNRHCAVLGAGAAAIAVVVATTAVIIGGRRRHFGRRVVIGRRSVVAAAGTRIVHGDGRCMIHGGMIHGGMIPGRCRICRHPGHRGMHHRHRSVEDQGETEQDAEQHGERRHGHKDTAIRGGIIDQPLKRYRSNGDMAAVSPGLASSASTLSAVVAARVRPRCWWPKA